MTSVEDLEYEIRGIKSDVHKLEKTVKSFEIRIINLEDKLRRK